VSSSLRSLLRRRLIDPIRSTFRYKLLALSLAPILLATPVGLAVVLYWGGQFTYEQLFIKVNTDLSVAHDVFFRLRQDYLDRLGRLAESYTFRTELERGHMVEVHTQLDQLRDAAGFSYLRALDPQQRRLFSPERGRVRASLLLEQALEGESGSGVEIFDANSLAEEGLAEQVRLPLLATPRATPTERSHETRGMLIRVVYPVRDRDGTVLALLDGGVLLNGNFAFVDTIRDLVYGPGSLREGSIGTVTVFLDDVRISTNVPLQAGERALGTRVSREVRELVLGRGENWIDRAFVVNDWYISAYEPIFDVAEQRVGMLYAGYLEAPYRDFLWQAAAVLLLMLLVFVIGCIVLIVRGAELIFRPVEEMARVVEATRRGEDVRIGELASQDEIGTLAREFDAMLMLLQHQHRQISAAADELEHKVDERTAELRRKNEDLERTIHLLRQTRKQLVMAEKLAALGELTAGVAHEINNPTAVILGNLDVIRAELGENGAIVADEMQLIDEQIYRIRDIVNNLLQYARPDDYAGYLDEVDVNELVRSTHKLIGHLTGHAGIVIELDCRATQSVQINPQELQQVLVNLLVNAIHAVDEQGGEIAVSTEDWEHKGVRIRVRDNGCGIEAEQLDRIFDPFFSTKEQGEGTGLGLSISYGLVRRYGGNLSVASRLGEGSLFTVSLLAKPVMIEDEATLAEHLVLASETVA
jgi:two-component system NtrC family sensor kinase